MAGSVHRALSEDRVRSDRTSRAVVDPDLRAVGIITAQGTGVLSGVSAAAEVARSLGLRIAKALPEGTRVRPGREVLVVEGGARAILGGERTMLNFLMHLSGVATATDVAVRAARPLVVLATRKTLPGLRALEKAAVVHGGGKPHRADLAEGILVKNNHLALVPIPLAIARLRAREGPGRPVQVEVRTRREALVAARSGADSLLIDNATPASVRAMIRALDVAGIRKGLWVEISGGITPEKVGRYRKTGADAVSLGSLTHSARAVPFHLTVRRRGNTPRLT